MRCVYFLKWNRWYTWSTNNLQRRLQEHKIKWYSAKRIWNRTCKWYIPCLDRQQARSLERKIKKSCHPKRYMNDDHGFVPYAGD